MLNFFHRLYICKFNFKSRKHVFLSMHFYTLCYIFIPYYVPKIFIVIIFEWWLQTLLTMNDSNPKVLDDFFYN